MMTRVQVLLPEDQDRRLEALAAKRRESKGKLIRRALELMLLNEPLSAERALEWGLVRQVVDDDGLLAEAMRLAHRLAEGPTRALVATRALIEESEHASFAAQFRREIELQAEIRKSEDALEGRKAFVEKRKARFTGR